ncbi:MAG: hypothetical protein SNJ67_05170 [Chloracidobacterium sp.]|uniref:DUF5666 domain-containing protein n=1 Tax=Chloracidobacterium validum TaxID=2821543 RepID=A0ABX8B8V5_9BACT|nr:hypothetical protein [Chloracidobacterium validum]QUW02065.1 hypothetical protein J8C06_06735 [Chloracidobacterium validum]
MLFGKKPKKSATLLEYGTVTGEVIGASEIKTPEGKVYQLFENPIHLKDTEPRPLDVTAKLGSTIKVAGSVGADTVYEAKLVSM